MIIGKTVPKSNSSLLKACDREYEEHTLHLLKLIWMENEKMPCLFPTLWILHGSGTLWHPGPLSCPGEFLLVNALKIFLLLLEYGDGRAFYFTSCIFFNIFVYLCWQTNLQHSVMPLHRSWQMACPVCAVRPFGDSPRQNLFLREYFVCALKARRTNPEIRKCFPICAVSWF